MANELEFIISGGITDTSAIIRSKIKFTQQLLEESKLCVMRLEYDGITLKSYGNSVLNTTTSGTGNWVYVNNMILGSDGDNVSFLNGYMPELLIYKNPTGIPMTNLDALNIERWLADKWMETNYDLNGYSVKASEGSFPIPTSAIKWLHFDETSLQISGNSVNSILDLASFNGVQKIGLPIDVLNTPVAEINKFKGKTVAKFNGNQNFKISGLHQAGDPDFITLFLIYKINDYSSTDNQTIIGSMDNSVPPLYNTAIRIKKYNGDDFINTSIVTNSRISSPIQKQYSFIQNSRANALIGTQQLYLDTTSGFTNPIISAIETCYSENNAVARFNITGLTPNIKYYGKVLLDSTNFDIQILEFNTFIINAPMSYKFIAGSCQETGADREIWGHMLNTQPLFFADIGDLHYEDIASNDMYKYREALTKVMASNGQRRLYNKTPLVYMFDDHDYGANNSTKYSPSKPASIGCYEENFPHYPYGGNPLTDGIYQAFTVGRVRFILTDLRSQREDSFIDDYSPIKVMMGVNQLAWFKNELLIAKSDENISLICWLNPGSWTGEDQDPYSWDYGASGEHWTAYKYERTDIYNFIYNNDIQNIFIICGDTHQQAIDDGRNSIFDNMYFSGKTINWRDLNPNLLIPVIESSPFDQSPDHDGGPYNINDIPDSGMVTRSCEQSFTTFEIIDNGYNWIQVNVEQYGIYNSSLNRELIKTKYFSFQRDCNGINTAKTPLNNIVPKFKTGQVILPPNESTIQRQIIFTNPTTFYNNYKGYISGYLISPAPNRDIYLYRRADIDYFSNSATTDPSTGMFTIKASMGAAQLVFKVYNTSVSPPELLYTIVNDGKNNNYYADILVEKYKYTDIGYLQESITLTDDNNYIFDISNDPVNDVYTYKLKRISTSEILAESPTYGLLPRSYVYDITDPLYNTSLKNRGYLYDSALSLIVATDTNKVLADRIVEGIIASKFVDKGFPFSTNIISARGADPYLRTGSVAWDAYALAYYLNKYPNSPNIIISTLENTLTYLESLRDIGKYNLLLGGQGRYVNDIFDPNYMIGWASTEHNIDTHFAFKMAGLVLNNSHYTTVAEEIGNSIVNNLYNSTTNRMYQGVLASGQFDTADALDCNSWGTLLCLSMGKKSYAESLLKRCEDYYLTTDIVTGAIGYKPYSQLLGYPNSTNTVWFEGSFGVALAYYKYYKIYNDFNYYLKYHDIMIKLFNFIENDGSFRYATTRDNIYEISNNKSTCSTSWSIIANLLKDNVWN